MDEKQAAIDAFVDMVDGPEEPITEQITEEDVTEALEEELPEGDELEVEPTPEGEDTAELFEVTVGDTVYEVPEALKNELEIAAMTTEKTQAASAERKTYEAAAAQVKVLNDQFEFMQSVSAEVGQIQALEAQIKQYRDYKRQNVDSLQPVDFIKIDQAIEELQEQMQGVQSSVQTKQTEFQQAQERSRKELLDKSTEAMRSKVPEWTNETDKATRDFGQSLGFTEDEVSAVTDPRYLHVLWMASQYQSLKDKTQKAVSKVKAAPKIQARKSMPKDTQERLTLRKKIKSDKLTQRQKQKLVEEDIGRRFG